MIQIYLTRRVAGIVALACWSVIVGCDSPTPRTSEAEAEARRERSQRELEQLVSIRASEAGLGYSPLMYGPELSFVVTNGTDDVRLDAISIWASFDTSVGLRQAEIVCKDLSLPPGGSVALSFHPDLGLPKDPFVMFDIERFKARLRVRLQELLVVGFKPLDGEWLPVEASGPSPKLLLDFYTPRCRRRLPGYRQ